MQIEIYSKEGKIIAKLFSDHQSKGIQEIEWKPGKLESGLYFYRISSNDRHMIGKMIYVK